MMAEHGNEENWLQKMKGSLYGLQLSSWTLRARHRGRYIFTDNKHPIRGIASTILGILSLATLFLSVWMTYTGAGNAQDGYAAAVLLAFVYAVGGLVMGILSRSEQDIYLLFPHLGIGLNGLTLCGVLALLFIGLR